MKQLIFAALLGGAVLSAHAVGTTYQYRAYAPGLKVASTATCQTPWGTTLQPGDQVTAWQAATAAACVSETRTCSSGALSGSYTFQSCAADIGTPAKLHYGMLADGNLFQSSTKVGVNNAAFASVGINKGKWYFEVTLDNNYSGQPLYDIGFTNTPTALLGYAWFAEQSATTSFGGYVHPSSTYFCSYTHCAPGEVNQGGVVTAFSSWAAGDVLGIAVDADSNTVKWYRNGGLFLTTTGITTPKPWYAGISGSLFSGTGVQFNFGPTGFKYPVPTGYNGGLGSAAQ